MKTHTVEVMPWAEPLWQRLVTQARDQRLPHALLISGHTGIGKNEFVLALAHWLLCHQPQVLRPCGQCRSCQLLSSNSHPDLVVLQPEEAGKPIKVDQIRELTQFLHATAQQGGCRLVIMEPAEAMNISAANALLKSLEEPGQNTYLLLVSHQPGQLMPTIRSRCQRIDFPRPTMVVATEWLCQRLGLGDDKAEQLLRIAQYAPLQAADLYEGEQMQLRARLMKGLADILRGRENPLELAAALQKEDLLLLLDWMHSLVADIARLHTGAEASSLTNRDMLSMLRAIADKTRAEPLFAFADLLQSERVSLMERYNPNRQLLLEALFMRWISLIR